MLLLAKRPKAGPVPLPLTFSLCFSAQGDELLIECRYQTLDRDSLTFVSTHLPTMVNDNSLRRALPLVLAIPSLRISAEAPLFLQWYYPFTWGFTLSHPHDYKMGTRIPIFSVNDSLRLSLALSSSPGGSEHH